MDLNMLLLELRKVYWVGESNGHPDFRESL